jgi:uncharacterized OB-fold protein
MSSSARYAREIPQRYRNEAARCVCGKVYYPPRKVCGEDREFETVVMPRDGNVITYTVIHVPPSGFEDQSPYALALVELDNGVRVMGQVVDCDPDEVEIGMAVRSEFRRISEEGHGGILRYGHKFVPRR